LIASTGAAIKIVAELLEEGNKINVKERSKGRIRGIQMSLISESSNAPC